MWKVDQDAGVGRGGLRGRNARKVGQPRRPTRGRSVVQLAEAWRSVEYRTMTWVTPFSPLSAAGSGLSMVGL